MYLGRLTDFDIEISHHYCITVEMNESPFLLFSQKYSYAKISWDIPDSGSEHLLRIGNINRDIMSSEVYAYVDILIGLKRNKNLKSPMAFKSGICKGRFVTGLDEKISKTAPDFYYLLWADMQKRLFLEPFHNSQIDFSFKRNFAGL